MSLSELNRLREAISEDPALASQIKQKLEGGTDAAAAYVQSLGYDVSPSDVSVLLASGEELSEHELELVSGGYVHGSNAPVTVSSPPPPTSPSGPLPPPAAPSAPSKKGH